MTEAKKKLSGAVLAATVAFALACGCLGLSSLDAAPAFADEPASTAATPKAKTVKIKYKGVSGAKNTNPAQVKKGATLKLKSPSKTGYKFKGWYQGKKKVTKLKKVKKTVTLTAKWEAKSYKIVYKNVKGTNKNAKTFKYGKTVKLKNLKKSGYEFKGWYADKELTKKIKKVGGKSAKNATVYGRWLKEPTTMEEAIGLQAAEEAIKKVNNEGAAMISEQLYERFGVWLDPTGKKFGCSKTLLKASIDESGALSAKATNFVVNNVDANWYLQALLTADYAKGLNPDYLAEGVTLRDFAEMLLNESGFTTAEVKYALDHTKF